MKKILTTLLVLTLSCPINAMDEDEVTSLERRLATERARSDALFAYHESLEKRIAVLEGQRDKDLAAVALMAQTIQRLTLEKAQDHEKYMRALALLPYDKIRELEADMCAALDEEAEIKKLAE